MMFSPFTYITSNIYSWITNIISTQLNDDGGMQYSYASPQPSNRLRYQSKDQDPLQLKNY